MTESITDVRVAVDLYGGVEKTAKFLKISNGSMRTYMATGYLPTDLAKKLGKATNVYWKYLLTPD